MCPRKSRRVPVCLTNEGDVSLVRSALSESGAVAVICADVSELCKQIPDEAEAVVIAEERLSKPAIAEVSEILATQPEWSDLPVLVASSGGAGSPLASEVVPALGNVLFLDHPLRLAALKHALNTALMSRDRQRRVCDLLNENDRQLHVVSEDRNKMEQNLRECIAEIGARDLQLRSLIGELILSEQRERRKLAQILHDNLQQMLVSAKFRVASLARIEEPTVKVAVHEIDDLIGQTIEASRSLTSELNPPILYESGLRSSIEWLIKSVARRHGLSVHFEIENDVPQIDKDTRVLLFESVRELLSNIVKHAEVRSAEINVRAQEDRLEILVADKGNGFDSASVKGNGVGLFTISERLKLVGGRLEIDSAPGKGTRLSLIAPLKHKLSKFEPASLIVDTKPLAVPSIPVSAKPVRCTIRVLLVEDHAIMRQGLMAALGQEPDMMIVGEASDGKMAVERTRNLRPDVVLMDLSLPRINGIEATRMIHSEMPEVRVIGLSMFEEEERAKAMFQAGAVAYLSKSCPVDALTSTIRRSVGKAE